MLIVSNSVGGGGIGISGNTAASIADFISAPPRGVFDVRLNADRGIRFSSPGQSTESTISSYQGNVTSNIRSLRLAGDLIYFNTSAGNDPSGSQRMVIDSSGKVGIATTSSILALTVQADSTDMIAWRSPSYTVGILGLDTTNAHGAIFLYTSGSQNTQITAKPGAYTYFNAGNVGIGTSSPGSLLTLFDSSTPKIAFQNSGAVRAAIQADSNSLILNSVTGNDIRFQCDSTERMRITSAGSVLVGTTEVVGSNSKLIVSSSDAGPSFINQTQAQQTFLLWNKGTSGDNLWTEFHAGASLSAKGTIDYNRASNVTRYNTSSDTNLKNIIGDSNKQKSIDILNSTKIREYSWKDDETNKSQIGVIAQELYQTFKGAVSKGSDAELFGTEDYKIWAIDKTAFTFHLIAGWQKHEQLIQELKAENDTLKAILQRNNIQ
jgi:hypothetical protein